LIEEKVIRELCFLAETIVTTDYQQGVELVKFYIAADPDDVSAAVKIMYAALSESPDLITAIARLGLGKDVDAVAAGETLLWALRKRK
jgi:hypothetical protein